MMTSITTSFKNCKAFCHELGRDVTAAEVWELMFGANRYKKAMTFKCPNPDCSAQFIIRNCYAYSSPSYASFRLYPRSMHIPNCPHAKNPAPKKKPFSTRSLGYGWYSYPNYPQYGSAI
jgi:hypothetical protein